MSHAKGIKKKTKIFVYLCACVLCNFLLIIKKEELLMTVIVLISVTAHIVITGIYNYVFHYSFYIPIAFSKYLSRL